MNKKSILYILYDLVFLIVFNTVFFAIGAKNYAASVWISYCFIHFAYLMVIATPILTRKNKNSSLFGVALNSISSMYFLIEFVVGLIFMFIGSQNIKAALIVQIIIAGIYAVLLLSNLIANENTADSVEQQDKDVAFIKDTASRVKLLIDMASDKKANNALEKAYDLIHASPSKSHSSVEVLEADIKDTVTALEDAARNDNTDEILQLVEKLVLTVEERNRRLKKL